MAKKRKRNKGGGQNDKYRMVPKPLGRRIYELTQSLLVMRDCLELVKQGKTYHLLPLYAQLRALLTEKRSDNEPLLLKLSKAFNIPLTLGFAPVPYSRMPESTVVTWVSLQLKTEPDGMRELMSLEEFLDCPVVFFSDRTYTARELIRSFAVNEGGAHFSASAPADFAGMVSFMEQPLQVNLFEIAEATFRLGVGLLQQLGEFELHTYVHFPVQKIDHEAYVFDFKYPSSQQAPTPLRIYCKFDHEARLTLGVIDIFGNGCETEGLSEVLGIEPFIHLSASLHIRADLKTELSLYIGLTHIRS